MTRFGMINSLTSSSLANKGFDSLRNGSDETIHTFTGHFMRHFVRQSIKGGRFSALSIFF